MPERPTPKNAIEALGLLRTAASDYEPREWVQGAYEDGLRFVAELEAVLREIAQGEGCNCPWDTDVRGHDDECPVGIAGAALPDTEGERDG